jgi:dihydroorotase
VILDLNNETVITPSHFKSLSRNTPFEGWRVKASVKVVIKNGKVVFKDGDIFE